jgi:drug/metabolite transporter (DMT)-like permease
MNVLGPSDSTRQTAVMFLALALFWGSSFVVIEVGLHHFPPVLFAALRYAVAGLLVLGYAARTADRLVPQTRDEWTVVGIAGVFVIAAYHALLYVGEQHVSAAVAAVVVSLAPVLTVAFAVPLLGDSIDLVGGVGLLTGVAGVVVVADPNPANLLSTDALGVVIVLVGAASFALGSVLTRPLRSDLPVESMQGWAMLVGAGVLFAGGFARGESLAAVEWTPVAVGSLLYLTLVSGVVAFLIYFTLLERIGPTEINLIGYLEPVVASGMSWLVLSQGADVQTLAGFLVVFAGFALLKRDALRERLFGRRGRRSASVGMDAD